MILPTKLFGDIEFECIERECEAEAEFKFRERTVTVSLWLDDLERDLAAMKHGLATLSQPDALDTHARKTFAAELEKQGRNSTRDYISEHMSYLSADVLQELVQPSTGAAPSKHDVLAALYLHHVRIHARDETARITLDYALSKKHSDSLLVVEMDQTGRLLKLVAES